jgi:hypothetical protein
MANVMNARPKLAQSAASAGLIEVRDREDASTPRRLSTGS